MGNKKRAASKRADIWFFNPKEAFKDCEISPDGSIIAFWTDFKISLYTQSFRRTENEELHPVAEFSLNTAGEARRFWKSISLTSRYLIASLSGNNFQVRTQLHPMLGIQLFTKFCWSQVLCF
jgi:hypothetical protein